MINKFVRIFLIVVFSLGIFSGAFLGSNKTALTHFHYSNGQVGANLSVSSNSCGSISVSYSGTNVLPYQEPPSDEGGGCTIWGYGYGGGTGVYQGGGNATFGDVPAGNYEYTLQCYNEYNGRENKNTATQSVTVAACPPPTGTIQGYCVDENNNAISPCNVVVDDSLPFGGTPYFATNLSAGSHKIAVHGISGYQFLGYTLDPNHGPVTTSTFPGTWPYVTVPAGGAVNVWFHFGRTVNGQCSSPATHNNCSAGTLGGSATYPDAQNPNYYSWHWWCNGSYGGGNQLCAEDRPACSATKYACTQGASGNNSASNSNYTWNCSAGGETIACSTPIPPPTGGSGSCDAAGTTGTLSWTAPSGHNTFYSRASTIGYGDWTAAVPGAWNDNFVGTTNNFTTIPGTTYYWWVHTKDPATGQWSSAIQNQFTCPDVPAPFCGTTPYACSPGTSGNNLAGHLNYSWNCSNSIGTTVACSAPIPPPTNVTGSCSADGTVGTVSWSLPSGYSNSYFRIVDNTASTYPPYWVPENLSDTGSSRTFATTPNHNYTAWVHTRVPGPYNNGMGGYSTEVYTSSFTCNVPPPAPNLTIIDTWGITNGATSGMTGYGASYGLSWPAVANATSCTLSDGVSAPSASTAGGTSTGVSADFTNNTRTFTLSCTGPGGTGNSAVTINYPPPPTSGSGSCNAAGTTGTFSWTAPSGYNTFYTRASLVGLGGSPYAPAWDDNFVGTTKTFATTPGTTYHWWVNTRSAIGAWSNHVNGSFTCTPAAVSVDNVTIAPTSVTPDGVSQYNITVTGTTANGGDNMTHQFAIINHEGPNAGMYRGYFTWYIADAIYDVGWNNEKDKIQCSGGGQAVIQSSGAYGGPYGHEYAELDSCSTSVNGNVRTTVFTVHFNTNFTTPTTNNTLSGYVIANGVVDGWKPFATFNLSSMTGTLLPSPASCEIALGASSCNVNLTWTTTNPQGVSAVTATGMDSVNGNNGSQSFVVPYGGRTFYLYNNSISLVPTAEAPNGSGVSVTSSCVSGAIWNGTTCQVPIVLSGSLSGSNCLIAEGESSCNTNLSWSIAHPESAPTAITANGMEDLNVSLDNTTTPQSGQDPVNIPFPGRTFYLYNNAKSLHPTAQSPAGSGLPLTARCDSGLIWDGSKCMEGVPRNPVPDLQLEGADHDSSQSALGVLPGQTVNFTWNTYQTNSSTECWLEGGVSGDNWIGAVSPDHSLDFPYTAPIVPGTYQYTLKCTQDRDLGMEESNNFLSLFVRNVAAADIVTVSDSAFLRVNQMIIDPCEGASACSCEGSTCSCYSGQCLTISWECTVPPSTASEGVGFSTDINPVDGIGDTSGSVTFVPAASGEYSMQCNNGGGSGSPIIVNVKKKPIINER